MSDDSIQKPIPESGGSQTPSQEQANDESADGQHDIVSPPSGDEDGKPKPILLSALLFAGFEALGYICTEIAEGLEGYVAMVVHWIALCCSAAGFFAAWHEIVDEKKASKIWTIYGLLCILLALIAYLVWHQFKPIPEPLPPQPPPVAIDIGPILDPKDVWGTTLIICNQGNRPIYNVWTIFYWNNPASSDKWIVYSHSSDSIIRNLLPNMKQGLHLANFPQNSQSR